MGGLFDGTVLGYRQGQGTSGTKGGEPRGPTREEPRPRNLGQPVGEPRGAKGGGQDKRTNHRVEPRRGSSRNQRGGGETGGPTTAEKTRWVAYGDQGERDRGTSFSREARSPGASFNRVFTIYIMGALFRFFMISQNFIFVHSSGASGADGALSILIARCKPQSIHLRARTRDSL